MTPDEDILHPRRVRLSVPGSKAERGERARLYVRWMPHIGAEAVALYELLRVLPEIGSDDTDTDELAELLRSTPESVERSMAVLGDHGFLVFRNGWIEVETHPPCYVRPDREGRGKGDEVGRANGSGRTDEAVEGSSGDFPERKIEVVRAEPEGVSAEDYFRYMGTLPAPHIIEFLNGYTERDGLEPDVIRESLRIASERDARRVGYVRSILERWVERGAKTMEDVELFEKDRRLRLVEQSGAVRGGAAALKSVGAGGGAGVGANRPDSSPSEEDYRWFWE